MTKRDRMAAFLKGEKVDRPPVSFWRHFYPDETTPEGLAKAMLAFQKKFDWDFMKVNPRASYHAEAFGSLFSFPSDGQKPQLEEPVVKSHLDWTKLRPPSPGDGVLGDHLRALEIIADDISGEVPFIMTIFTPMSVAANLCADMDQFLYDMRKYPGEVHAALEVVSQTFAEFAEACVHVGASGIFLATTNWATRDRLTLEEYLEFGRAYDLEILSPIIDKAELLVLHVCKGNNMLLNLLDYPVRMFNWDAADPANPDIAGVRDKTDKCLIGGVSHLNSFAEGLKDKALKEARQAFKSTGGNKWALGAGCTIPMDASEDTLFALRQAVEGMNPPYGGPRGGSR